MNSSVRQLEDHSASPSLRRPRRMKTQSSLKGMFESDYSSKSFDSIDSIEKVKYSAQERDELKMMTRKLRQAKRKLFLKSVAAPVEPVDKLRDILLKLSVDSSSDEISWNSNSVNSLDLGNE